MVTPTKQVCIKLMVIRVEWFYFMDYIHAYIYFIYARNSLNSMIFTFKPRARAIPVILSVILPEIGAVQTLYLVRTIRI